MSLALRSALAASALLVSFAAVAKPTPRFVMDPVDQRQAQQAARIDHALARGALDRRELRTLRTEQQRIARYEAQARADGRIDRFEWHRLDAMLDRFDAQLRQMIRRG